MWMVSLYQCESTQALVKIPSTRRPAALGTIFTLPEASERIETTKSTHHPFAAAPSKSLNSPQHGAFWADLETYGEFWETVCKKTVFTFHARE